MSLSEALLEQALSWRPDLTAAERSRLATAIAAAPAVPRLSHAMRGEIAMAEWVGAYLADTERGRALRARVPEVMEQFRLPQADPPRIAEMVGELVAFGHRIQTALDQPPAEALSEVVALETEAEALGKRNPLVAMLVPALAPITRTQLELDLRREATRWLLEEATPDLDLHPLGAEVALDGVIAAEPPTTLRLTHPALAEPVDLQIGDAESDQDRDEHPPGAGADGF